MNAVSIVQAQETAGCAPKLRTEQKEEKDGGIEKLKVGKRTILGAQEAERFLLAVIGVVPGRISKCTRRSHGLDLNI